MKQTEFTGVRIYEDILELVKELNEIDNSLDALWDVEHSIARGIISKRRKEVEKELNKLKNKKYIDKSNTVVEGDVTLEF